MAFLTYFFSSFFISHHYHCDYDCLFKHTHTHKTHQSSSDWIFFSFYQIFLKIHYRFAQALVLSLFFSQSRNDCVCDSTAGFESEKRSFSFSFRSIKKRFCNFSRTDKTRKVIHKKYLYTVCWPCFYCFCTWHTGPDIGNFCFLRSFCFFGMELASTELVNESRILL